MTLSRRGFLGTLIGGVAAGAAVRTWPFRVFSFPSQIKTTGLIKDIYRANGDALIKTFMQNGQGSTVIAKNAMELSQWREFGYEVVQHDPKELTIANKLIDDFIHRRQFSPIIEPLNSRAHINKMQISLPGRELDNDMLLKSI